MIIKINNRIKTNNKNFLNNNKKNKIKFHLSTKMIHIMKKDKYLKKKIKSKKLENNFKFKF